MCGETCCCDVYAVGANIRIAGARAVSLQEALNVFFGCLEDVAIFRGGILPRGRFAAPLAMADCWVPLLMVGVFCGILWGRAVSAAE